MLNSELSTNSYRIMKTHAQHPVSTSRTLSRSSKAPNLISMNELLQRGPVTQRMVGFEFQTVGGAWNVKKKDGQNWVDPGHGDLIDTLDSKIKVTADGTDLEFITEPVDEREDAEINSLGINVTNAFIDFETRIPQYGSTNNEVPYNNYLINKLGERNAHPQATVGVKLENIIDLMEHVTNMPITTEIAGQDQPIFGHSTFATQNTTSEEDRTSPAGKQRDAVKKSVDIAKRYPTVHLNKKEKKQTKGLIALIEHLIKVNEDANSDTYSPNSNAKKDYNANAKNKMPVMPRTSLIDMYLKMENKARKKVLEYLREKPNKIIMYQTTISKAINEGLNRPTLYREVNDDGYTTNALKMDLISKNREWYPSKVYNGIGYTETTERTSRRTDDKSTDIGYDIGTNKKDRVEGGIFELRSLPNQIAPNQWGNVVTKVAQVIKDINAI